jgi:hypothetical protein
LEKEQAGRQFSILAPPAMFADCGKEWKVMKKISLGGVVLGLVLGVVVATISGTWILWLSAGLAVGMLIGAAAVRRDPLSPGAKRKELRA